MARILSLSIFRYNPSDPASAPRMDNFLLDESERMTLFIALNRLREEQDASLQFDFCCRAGICGPKEVTLLPLPGFDLVGDLSVDTGKWFRAMYARVESWVHTDKAFDPTAEEERMDNALAEQIYELERCIECGCCVSACGTAQMRPDFLGAVGLNRIARFMVDPRDERTDSDYFDIVGNDAGVFGCMGLLACEDVCPKEIPLQDQLGILRRKMAFSAVKDIFRMKEGKKK
jgi:fumarate reductase iron-sulfur subunit